MALAGTHPRTFRAVLEYDGTDFHGWQVQAGRRTVQGVLEEALASILSARVPVIAAGRTDAGVHALGQLVSFRAATGIPPERLAAALNSRLPPDAAILSLEEAPADFHATRDARSKVYRYLVLEGRTPRPLLRRTTWRVPVRLDLRRMREAARCLVGRHDFASFRTNPGPEGEGRGTVRRVLRVDLRRRGGLLALEVEGEGFLYNMVRAIAGTLVEVGRGRWEPGRVAGILAARDRRAAGPTAPARGLVLVSVAFGPPRTAGRRRSPGGRKLDPRPPARPRMVRKAGRRRPGPPGEAMP
ncbi:MAG: tRNA pseudouridine(38-40) synthase TruA [Planctomycetes bacterium]|nr:tRNA pseudouridine(38-40) synthase TruA [Planctomycetota bacterium]